MTITIVRQALYNVAIVSLPLYLQHGSTSITFLMLNSKQKIRDHKILHTKRYGHALTLYEILM